MQERTHLDMTIDLDDFFQSKVPNIIDNVKGDEQPIWGIMTIQHMLEHLVLPLNFAIGTVSVSLLIPEEKIPKQLEYLFSDYALPRNFKPTFLPLDKLVSLNYETLDGSKEYLKNAITEFLNVVNNPNFTTKLHPFNGELDKKGWLTFQYKHFAHHFMQFGLM